MSRGQRLKSTGTDGGFEKGAAVGCGGLSPYSVRYLVWLYCALRLMRVAAMLALCSEGWLLVRTTALCRLGHKSAASHRLKSVVWQSGRWERDRVPGGREGAVWLRGRLD